MRGAQDSPAYAEVQRVLREEVVNPLRRRGYVRADRVMRLRTLLERLSDVPGLTCEEKVLPGSDYSHGIEWTCLPFSNCHHPVLWLRTPVALIYFAFEGCRCTRLRDCSAVTYKRSFIKYLLPMKEPINCAHRSFLVLL